MARKKIAPGTLIENKTEGNTVSQRLENETSVEAEYDNIPELALRLLRIFSDQEYLYVNSKGGVFRKDHKPSPSEAAILYKNPFYNN